MIKPLATLKLIDWLAHAKYWVWEVVQKAMNLMPVCVCVYAHASGKEQNCINIALLNLSRLIKVTFGLDTHKRCSQC